MTLLLFALAWIIAVICMTLSSALWSRVSGNQFREPTLLSKLMQNHPHINASKQNTYVWGWLIHFILGIVFLVIYEILWQITNVPRTFMWSLIFGSFLGLLGVLGWKILFKMSKPSSQFNYQQYYIHIFFAHIVFSVNALLVFQWLPWR